MIFFVKKWRAYQKQVYTFLRTDDAKVVCRHSYGTLTYHTFKF